MALAANALTTVAQVKAASSVSCSDARIEFLIDEVSAAIEQYTGRSFGYAKVGTIRPDYYKGSGTSELWLRRLPILNITRVRIDGAEITDYWQTSMHDAMGVLLRGAANAEAGWERGIGIWPDLTGDYNYLNSATTYNIDICGEFGYILPQFTPGRYNQHNPDAGPQTLPRDIEGACIREVLRREQNPVSGIKREKTPGGWEIERFGAADFGISNLSEETRTALAPYCLPARWFV